MWVVGRTNLVICPSPHPAVQAQCSSTQETLLRVEFNKLLVDHRVLDRLQLSRDQVNCYYKYINWVNDESYNFEEESIKLGSTLNQWRNDYYDCSAGDPDDGLRGGAECELRVPVCSVCEGGD